MQSLEKDAMLSKGTALPVYVALAYRKDYHTK